MINFFKNFFIFFWGIYSRIALNNYLKNNKHNNKTFSKNIKILIIKHFSYSDLYSPNINSKIGTIKSSRYRVGPISIILDFKSMIAISDYLNDRKLKLNEFKFFQRYNYFKFLYKNRINFNNFNFSKFHWVIALKDTIPSEIMKKNKNILWTLLFEDHKEKNYVKFNILVTKNMILLLILRKDLHHMIYSKINFLLISPIHLQTI